MVAFLESMTGEIPTDYIAKPELPEDGSAEAVGDPAVDPAGEPAQPKPAKKPAEPASE
jgi:cytochrome c peroxidase